MARKKTTDDVVTDARIADYRYDDSKRKNIPPAGLAAQGKVAESNRIEYAYNPHLPPILRFDDTDTGQADYVGADGIRPPFNRTGATELIGWVEMV